MLPEDLEFELAEDRELEKQRDRFPQEQSDASRPDAVEEDEVRFTFVDEDQ